MRRRKAATELPTETCKTVATSVDAGKMANASAAQNQYSDDRYRVTRIVNNYTTKSIKKKCVISAASYVCGAIWSCYSNKIRRNLDGRTKSQNKIRHAVNSLNYKYLKLLYMNIGTTIESIFVKRFNVESLNLE